jgi:hypothetical protein
LTEDKFLETVTFEKLCGQAEQMAQEYVELKNKYVSLKDKYNNLCAKYEKDMQDIAVSVSFKNK